MCAKKRLKYTAAEIFLWDNMSSAMFKFPGYIKVDNYGDWDHY